MRTFLNGVAKQIIHNNLLQLIQYLPLEGKHFAVEHNQRIISKSQLQHIFLQDQVWKIRIILKLFMP